MAKNITGHCLRCLRVDDSKQQRCDECQWKHAARCDGKKCEKYKCGAPAWPECPLPNPDAAGDRYAPWLEEKHARERAAAAQKRDDERQRLQEEIAANLSKNLPPPSYLDYLLRRVKELG